MRVCLLGDFTGRPDEGMKNVSKNIRENLSLRHNVLALNSRDVLTKTFLNKIQSFQPEITHYLHGPTIRSFIILKILRVLTGNKSKTISSATKPYFSKISRHFLPLLRTSLILTQSEIWENFFKGYGFHVRFFPNGVDSDKFYPAKEGEKKNIRDKYGFKNNDFIVLHVGHIKANRNLETFKEIQKLDRIQVVIVGGTTEKTDENIKKDLEKSGIKIYHKYFDDISKIYRMSDIYVFPVKDTENKLPLTYNQVGAIDLPLSIMEAMASNLPVITTPFGALPRLFKPGDGLYFYANEEEIIPIIQQLSYKNERSTRDKVLLYDWKRVIKRLEKIYQEII